MSLSASVQSCIQECLRCYQACQSNAAGMCLEQGGAHVEPEHMRLMLSCAEVCRTAAAVMLNQSPQHPVVCRASAELCSACADSCARVGGMDECVQACRACAESCRGMAA
jgi:hypothetical protein